MLQNIAPDRKRSKAGSLTGKEKRYAKTLLDKKYAVQDIAFIINQGREKTVNQSVIQSLVGDKCIKTVDDKELDKFLKIQSSYDPKTLLNPFKDERLIRAREAMMAAVQIFNSPTIVFKTEIFCVLANIAWTYLLHEKLERTKKGSSILNNGNSVTVGGTLNKQSCPIKNEAVKENLRKLIKIRDAVEHTYFVGGEECFGALFQACCINFDKHMTEWFGQHISLSEKLSLALQFVRLQKAQIIEIEKSDLPEKIRAISKEIQDSNFATDNAFQLKVYYTTEATSKTNADLHKLLSSESGVATGKEVIKKVSREKITQKQLLELVHEKGFKKFTSTDHINFWKTNWETAAIRNKKAGEFGEVFNGWGWYKDKWLPVVLKHCKDSGDKYKWPARP